MVTGCGIQESFTASEIIQSENIQSGATSGSIPYANISFCRPIPDRPHPLNGDPPRDSCGIFTRSLDDYPLNMPTLTGDGIRTFGKSEMVMAFVSFENYPRSGGNVEFTWKRPDGSIMVKEIIALAIPDPSWSWWYAWAYAIIGKFDNTTGYSVNEIIEPGTYRVDISTPWGSANIDFTVSGSQVLPSISNVYTEITLGGFDVVWTQNKAGDVRLYQNGSERNLISGILGVNRFSINNVSAGTYNMCIKGENMVCASITISQPAPTIPTVSNLILTNLLGQIGKVNVTWRQDIAGKIRITVEGGIVSETYYGMEFGGANQATLSGLTPGKTYNNSICVIGVA